MEPEASSPKIKKWITRREFLGITWIAALGILTFRFGRLSLQFALPPVREGQFGGLFNMGLVSELPEPGAPPINEPEGRFWLMHTEEGLSAFYKVCTHLDCLYNWDEQQGEFICPCHGSEFTDEGAYLSGPAPRALDSFPIQLVTAEGEIIAESDPEKGGALPIPSIASIQETNLSEEPPEIEVTETTTPEAVEASGDVYVIVDTSKKISGKINA